MRNPAFVFTPEQLDPNGKPLVRVGKHVGRIATEWGNGTVAVLTNKGKVIVAHRHELERK